MQNAKFKMQIANCEMGREGEFDLFEFCILHFQL